MVSRVGSIIVDRSAEFAELVEVLKTVHKRKIQILAFANNHSGYGPGTVQMFRDLWRRQVTADTSKPNRMVEQGQLF